MNSPIHIVLQSSSRCLRLLLFFTLLPLLFGAAAFGTVQAQEPAADADFCDCQCYGREGTGL